MTTLELQAFKAQLIDEFANDVNDASSKKDILSKLQAFLHKRLSDLYGEDAAQSPSAWGRVPGVPGTREELENILAKFNRRMDAKEDMQGLNEQEANAQIRQILPWLK